MIIEVGGHEIDPEWGDLDIDYNYSSDILTITDDSGFEIRVGGHACGVEEFLLEYRDVLFARYRNAVDQINSLALSLGYDK